MYKMRGVNITCLYPGCKVSRPIYNSNGVALVAEGTRLTEGYINILKNLGIPLVYIDDGIIPDLKIQDIIHPELRISVVSMVRNIFLKTKQSGKLAVNIQHLFATIIKVIENLYITRSQVFNLIDLRLTSDYVFSHSANVCILSIKAGISLGYNRSDLLTLGIGALLHDLGQVTIPEILLNKPGPLTPEEYAVIQKHTGNGYQMLMSSKQLGKLPAIIALQHHENYDGSGYPGGIDQEKYHEFAQIVAIADRFDAITSNRPFRERYLPDEACEMLAAAGNYLVKHKIANAFLSNIAAYPTGTLVELSSGETAVVTGTLPGYSFFPIVRILFDETRQPLATNKELFLANEEVFIARVLQGEESCLLLNQLNLAG